MDKVRHIIQGWGNHFLYVLGLKKRVEWKRRRAICSTCPTNVRGVCSKMVCNQIGNDHICGCGCPIEKKIKSDSNCPKGYWGNE